MDEDICQMAFDLANRTSFKLVLLVKIVICLLGVAATLACIRLEGVKWLVHCNAKVIFIFHLVLAVYVPFFYAISMGFDLIRLSATHSDKCAYTLSTTTSFTIRAIPVCGLVTQSYVMCAASIERTVSTLCAKSYEKIKKPYFGIALVVASVLFSGNIVFWLLYYPIKWDALQFVTTIRTKDNSPYYQVQLYLYMAVELITIILFIVTYFTNGLMYKKITKSGEKAALGNKYQIKENRQIIVALLPCFLIHFALNVLSTFGITLWQKVGGTFHQVDSAICIEYLSHAQMYSLIMPSLILYRLRQRRHRVITNTYKNIDSHFAQLVSIFDKK